MIRRAIVVWSLLQILTLLGAWAAFKALAAWAASQAGVNSFSLGTAGTGLVQALVQGITSCNC